MLNRRGLRAVLAALLLIALLPVNALAAKQSIKFPVKLGLMLEGDSVTLKPKLKGLKRDALVWASSDESAAIVTDGTITALKAGRTAIMAAADGVTAVCGVVVLPKEVTVKRGETVSLPRGGKEKYKIKDKKIASVSKSGALTGLKIGETALRVSYGKQKLTLTVRVVGGDSAVAGLDCAAQTDQIVLVEYTGGSDARLSLHEKKDGAWVELADCAAYVGANGIDKTREGDKRTPTGTFNLTTPFGIKSDPGAAMPYTKVTKYHYWCGTSGSEYYNRLVDTREVDRPREKGDEYLISYKGSYNYCLFIDYNAAGEAGKGSCIFLHCTGKKKYTAGCVAVPQDMMKQILRWARSGAKIVIRVAQ